MSCRLKAAPHLRLEGRSLRRVRSLIDGDGLTIDDQRELLSELGKSVGWDDPAMDVAQTCLRKIGRMKYLKISVEPTSLSLFRPHADRLASRATPWFYMAAIRLIPTARLDNRGRVHRRVRGKSANVHSGCGGERPISSLPSPRRTDPTDVSRPHRGLG